MTQESAERTLGMLLAEVRNLRADIDRQERKSDESRASMHRRVDALVDRVSAIEGEFSAVKKEVVDMKPVTDDVKRWKIMGMTAIAVIGIGGAAMGVTFAEAIKRVLAVIFGRAM
jgi:glucose-6-phosphate isomerase